MAASAAMVTSPPSRSALAVPSSCTSSPSAPPCGIGDCSKNITGSVAASRPFTSTGVDSLLRPGTIIASSPTENVARHGTTAVGRGSLAAYSSALGHVTRLAISFATMSQQTARIGKHDSARPTVADPGHAENGLFRDRRVTHTDRAEFVQQPDGRLEHAAGGARILAEKTTSSSRRISWRWHRPPPHDRSVPPCCASIGPDINVDKLQSGAGGLEISVASSTWASTSASMPSITFQSIPNSARRPLYQAPGPVAPLARLAGGNRRDRRGNGRNVGGHQSATALPARALTGLLRRAATSSASLPSITILGRP